MAKSVKRKPSRLRRIFRWCRISVLLAILAAVIAGIYLNSVGLPDFLKRPLLAKLRNEGVQVDFSRMRLRWYRGIVVDKATFTFLQHPLQPKFSSAETELNLEIHSLRASHLKLNSLAIKQGNLVWPVSKTNETALTLSNITTRIQFRSGDGIELDGFQADFANTRIQISGSVTNVSSVSEWKMFQRKTPSKGKGGLEKIAGFLEKIHLSGSSKITLDVTGDAADLRSIKANLGFVTAAVETPWGRGENLQLTGALGGWFTDSENNFLRLKAGSVETPWGKVSDLNCLANVTPTSANGDTFQTDLAVSARQLFLDAGHAASVQLSGQSSLSFTNLVPAAVSGKTSLVDAETKWGKVDTSEITFSVVTNRAPKLADESWAAWRKAEPFLLNWNARLAGVETPELKVEKVFCTGNWHAPELELSELKAELYGGRISASGGLDISTRQANAKGFSDFDVHKISPLLTPFGQRWIGKYTWEKPPQLAGDLRVVLPAWTNWSNPSLSWRKEVLPTLELNGRVTVESGTYRNVSATSASTDFTYSNMIWTLPHLRVERPEGSADLNLVANDRTREYHWRIHSQIDPKALRHLLEESAQRRFDEFQLTTPPTIRGDIRGHWNEWEKISFGGEIAANNFSFRSNSIDKLTCDLQFTNQYLQVSDGLLESDGKFISAKKVGFHVPTKKVFFTEVYSTADPNVVARAIGRKVAAGVAPFQFAEPPSIRLNGSLTATNVADADMHFYVDGPQFQWTHFKMDRIAGDVDWINETLLLTNVHAKAYLGGTLIGSSYFDFAPTNGTELRFDVAASDVDLQTFVRSVTGKTNHLEGLLHAHLTIDSGNSRDFKTWRGNGRANLRDGLIWDVPVFGIFSPILNTLVPGAGNSRAREASANFVITNGIINSDDLEIRAAGLRLHYDGGVDFEQQVDARVEAELLRDTWVVGRLVSLALLPISKIFEYKVSGTLSAPKMEPVYIPNFLMMSLRPFHSLKEVLLPEKTESPPKPNPTEPKP